MQAGTWVQVRVSREVSPYGYYLTDGKQDVLLPYSDIQGEIALDQGIDVFLYHDTLDRLIATMKKPTIVWGQVALLPVVDMHPRFGYFLDMGLGRHVLMPFKHVSDTKELRPQVGDKVYTMLDHDRQGRLIAKPATEEQLAPMCVRAPAEWKNRVVFATVYKSLQMGTFVICEAGVLGFGVIGFIATSERTRMTRLGERLEMRVTFVREDGRVNGSLRPLKQVGMDEDANAIIRVLSARPGQAMPYSDETPADVIQQRFNMSKAAFKRALGRLMKEGRVTQKQNWTYLQVTDAPQGVDEQAHQEDSKDE